MVAPPDVLPMDGFTVAVTADRRAGEQAELLRRRGAEVVQAPTIATGYLGSAAEVVAATAEIVSRPPDVVIANTAIGMRAWLESAQSAGTDDALLAALARSAVIARGPKAASACHQLGINVAHEVAGERLDAVLVHLLSSGVAGRRIAFQRHGAAAPGFVEPLRAAGAEVIDVPVYRYGLPPNRTPASRLIEAIVERRVDAVTFTSRPAVDNLFTLAAEAGLAEEVRTALDGDVAAACIGPVCAAGAMIHGLSAPLFPATGRLGLLVRLLSEHLAGRARDVPVGHRQVRLQGCVVIAGDRVQLSPREAAVLRVLARRPGTVVAAPVVLRTVWGPSTSAHALEVTVARLRRRLAPLGLTITTVPSRGYRLTPIESLGQPNSIVWG